MQEFKVLSIDITGDKRSSEAAEQLNDLATQGWEILTSGIATTSEYAESRLSVVLVRDIMATEAAPVETPRKFETGDRVKVVTIVAVMDELHHMKCGIVHSYIEPDSDYDVVLVDMDEGGLYSFYEYQLARTTQITPAR